MTLSIRSRLTLWYCGLTAVALALLSVGVMSLHTRWGQEQFDTELLELASGISRVMIEELAESGKLAKAAAETRETMDVPDRATAILTPTGTPSAAVWHGFTYDRAAVVDATAVPRFDTLDQHGAAWRVLRMRESSVAGDYVILVAGQLEPFQRQQMLLRRVLFTATPIIVAVTAGLAWWVAFVALRPVTIMAAEAEAFTVRPADWRLDATASNDELGQLARAFNRLLGRLEGASSMQRHFMADASHELRTPVSVIQTAAEVTLEQADRASSEYREALTIVSEQSTRLARMVQDMFVLARADAGQAPVMKPLYLDDVVAECARAIAVVADAAGIAVTVDLDEDVSVMGDQHLLEQMVTNLLDNAVRFSPPGAAVSIALRSANGVVTVAVVDHGPGIPVEDRERVFERFVRLDRARSSSSGAGLGLPIARWIAEQHQGTLIVESGDDGGSRFIAVLPTLVSKMNVR
ncbi:MAG TPA: ATP-binding protein [Vicinamibacterales bacterium]